MKRSIYDDDHELFRESYAQFLRQEIQPNYTDWENAGIIARDAFRRAGAGGFLGMEIPEEYGGAGVRDMRFNAVLNEEAARYGVTGWGASVSVHSDLCIPYVLDNGTPEQCERWLPGIASGDLLMALAMTEPGTGSDVAAVSTTARLDGDHYVVNGAKTFISNGFNADLILTVVRTGEAPRRGGLSLLMIPRDVEGLSRGRNLEKIGLHAQDTTELFFTDARVPAENLVGQSGQAWEVLRQKLARERLVVAIATTAAARTAVSGTLDYVKERHAFGKPIGSFQVSRHSMARAHAMTEMAETYVDRCVLACNDGTLTPEDAAMAKWLCSDIQNDAIDRCVQLHGGYGYMREYPIARAYADARVTKIYGGSNEIMAEIVGRSLGL